MNYSQENLDFGNRWEDCNPPCQFLLEEKCPEWQRPTRGIGSRHQLSAPRGFDHV
jgi:hypothetical protein